MRISYGQKRSLAQQKKIVSICLLNLNNEVKGLVRHLSMCKEIFAILYENDLGVERMVYPETLMLGLQRW